MKGCYAFFDYAASHWLDHLTKAMVSNPTTSDRCSMDRLSTEIRRFLGRHFQNVSAKDIPPSFIQGFNPHPLLGPQDFLDTLTEVAYSWSVSGKNEQCMEPASGLGDFIPQLRSCLDSAAQRLEGTTGLKQLQQYHGTGLFKCRFVHCDYFHLGFTEKLARDSHQNRHEQSFVCMSTGCPLENHIRDAHSTGTDNDVLTPEFPLLPPSTPQAAIANQVNKPSTVENIAPQGDPIGPIIRNNVQTTTSQHQKPTNTSEAKVSSPRADFSPCR